MAIEAHYVDTSAVLAVLYGRPGDSAFADADNILVSSELTAVELTLELRRKELSKGIDAKEARQLRKETQQLLSLVRLFPVSDEVLDHARERFPFVVGLRTALHVATAQVVSADAPKLSFWTWIEADAAAAASRELMTRGFERKA